MKQLYYFWALLPLACFLVGAFFQLRDGVRPTRYFYGPRSSQAYCYSRADITNRLAFFFLLAWTFSVVSVEAGFGKWITETALFYLPERYQLSGIFGVFIVVLFAGALLLKIAGWRGKLAQQPLFGTRLERVYVLFFVIILLSGVKLPPDGSSPLSDEGGEWIGREIVQLSPQLAAGLKRGIAMFNSGLHALKPIPEDASTPVPAVSIEEYLSGIADVDDLLTAPADEVDPYAYFRNVESILRSSMLQAYRAGREPAWIERSRRARPRIVARVMYAFQANVRINRDLRARSPAIADWIAASRWLSDDEFIRWLNSDLGSQKVYFSSRDISGAELSTELERFRRQWLTPVLNSHSGLE